MSSEVELLQGALDLILLRALEAMGPQHAYSLAARLEQVSKSRLTLKQGTLYPALVRVEQNGWIKGSWRRTENNREAKYYSITKAGTRSPSAPTQPSSASSMPCCSDRCRIPALIALFGSPSSSIQTTGAASRRLPLQ